MRPSPSARAAVLLLAFAGCRRYDYRPPSCPPDAPRRAVRVEAVGGAPGVVAGVVSAEHTGRPVDFAVVALLPGGRTDTTDATGAFRFEAVPPGRHTLAVRRIGYESSRDILSVSDGAGLQLAVSLDPEALDGCPGFVVVQVPRPWWRWLW